MNDLPRHAIARTAKLASLPLGYAGRAALGAGKRLGGAPAEAVAAELQARTARQVFGVLGQLKGGAMKVGQALSVLEAALPEELTGPYRAVLTQLQEAAPPMPTGTVHEVIADGLGPDWQRSFLAFDDRPAACASIGQVHRATWSDGREVAVKVQYPGAGAALLGDFRRLSRTTKLATGLLPGVELGPVLDELLRRVEEELDYQREADCQARFAEAFRDDPHVLIPDVVHQAGHVLITEWIEGTPLSSIIASGAQDERDLASERYLEFLMSAPDRVKLLHADPHPGNFRLTDDGRLIVLDFGAVDQLPDGLPLAIGRVLHLTLSGDARPLSERLRAEGFIRPGTTINSTLLLEFLAPFTEPLLTERFHFNRAWMRTHANRLQDPRRADFGLGLRLTLPPEYLLIHRVWLGGVAVLCQIGGDVPARAIVDRYLPGAQLDPLPTETTE